MDTIPRKDSFAQATERQEQVSSLCLLLSLGRKYYFRRTFLVANYYLLTNTQSVNNKFTRRRVGP